MVFDPSEMSFRDLLEFFFQVHDPTTVNRQGNDIGTSYRSAIFYTGEEQKQVAEDTIADVDASGLWPGKVVTEVTAAGPFWEAEPEHQDYLEKIPDGYTCHLPTAQLEATQAHRIGWLTSAIDVSRAPQVIGDVLLGPGASGPWRGCTPEAGSPTC